MAVVWDWKDKCGEATFYSEVQDKEFTVNLYKGNAFLIFINEYEEDGKDMYSVYSFFIDEKHAKRCLGLEKGDSNIFNDKVVRLKGVRLNKSKYSEYKKLTDMLIKAFDEITIEIFSEG